MGKLLPITPFPRVSRGGIWLEYFIKSPPKRAEPVPSRWLREEPRELVRSEKIVSEHEARRPEVALSGEQLNRTRGRRVIVNTNRSYSIESYRIRDGREFKRENETNIE